jgi:hypothetical protein
MSSQVPHGVAGENADHHRNDTFSIRQLLRERKALLVHFNTPQSKHATGFPEDLRNAKTVRGQALSFSTILALDRGPYQVADFADANAGGSVGIIVDINEEGSVISVSGGDAGSNQWGDLGKPPSEQACIESIDKRNDGKPGGNNEWRVQDYIPLGIFVFSRPFVFKPGDGEVPISLQEILSTFPEDRVYSAGNGSFQQYDRETGQWLPVSYSDIVPV